MSFRSSQKLWWRLDDEEPMWVLKIIRRWGYRKNEGLLRSTRKRHTAGFPYTDWTWLPHKKWRKNSKDWRNYFESFISFWSILNRGYIRAMRSGSENWKWLSVEANGNRKFIEHHEEHKVDQQRHMCVSSLVPTKRNWAKKLAWEHLCGTKKPFFDANVLWDHSKMSLAYLQWGADPGIKPI
jgi:hypothetical protein